ncbi:hypothetical protein QJQ45_010270 [Haematococcus lacustris]|nr:hypothetical protein QJQ45_010270 [Haematococcus lacustris]
MFAHVTFYLVYSFELQYSLAPANVDLRSGFLSILYSIGSKPLQIWDKQVRNGHIKRITDQDIQSSVLEICGDNVANVFITAPADPTKTLGIKLPFLVMIIKNLKKYFSFEVQVLDDKNVRRRFRASNYQSTTRVKPFICTMPMRLDDGWNQIQFNLSDFTRRAYDRLYSEEELPPEFKLFLPIQKDAEADALEEEEWERLREDEIADDDRRRREFEDLMVMVVLAHGRPGPRPTELCYWESRPTMLKPGRLGQEWVYVRDKALLRKWRRKWQRG